MNYWSTIVSSIITTVIGMYSGAHVVRRAMDRADARHQVREWDKNVAETTGMCWNPITRHYERPPGTVPFDPRGYGRKNR